MVARNINLDRPRRARHYDPNTGRFLNQDPLGILAGDPNYYRYVFNSPLGGIDPSGNGVQSIAGLGLIFLGGTIAIVGVKTGPLAALIGVPVGGAVMATGILLVATDANGASPPQQYGPPVPPQQNGPAAPSQQTGTSNSAQPNPNPPNSSNGQSSCP